MTTYIDRIPLHEQAASYDYQERLKHEAEELLFHPALRHLLAVATEEQLIPQAAYSALLSSADEDGYASSVALLAKTAFDRRHGTGIERHQLNDDPLSLQLAEAIRQTVGELHMTKDIPVPTGSFEVAAVLGATAAPIAKRTNYLYDALEKGATRASVVVGLGAERPLSDIDTRYARLYPYINETRVETELLAHAAKDWFAAHGYSAPAVDQSVPAEAYVKDETFGSKYRIQTVAFDDGAYVPQWAPNMIINLSPPFEKTHHPRANTGETIRFLLKLADLQPGCKLLFTSSQPYLLGQKFEIQRLCLDAGVEVEVAGYGVNNTHLSAAALGDEIAKATTKAAALHAALK